MNNLEKLRILRQKQINTTVKPKPRIEYYQKCVLRDNLDIYYKHHAQGTGKIVYPEEVI